jgi:hypothetical protein
MSKNKINITKKVDYSIGIVTYVERFNKSFKQLALELSRQFPDVEKNVILNGFPDKEKQLRYIKEATAFLNKCGFTRVISFEEHQALAKGWNLLVINSDAPKILILNDDCSIESNFRYEFESQRQDYDWLFLNESFSHFMTSKRVVKNVGWFDERFLGIGHEDGDYARRCAIKNFEYDVGVDCPSLKNLQIQEEFVSFTTKKNEKSGNYSVYNEIFFKKKWSHAAFAKSGYTYIPIRHLKRYANTPPGEGSYCKLNRGMETPVFYPFSILD